MPQIFRTTVRQLFLQERPDTFISIQLQARTTGSTLRSDRVLLEQVADQISAMNSAQTQKGDDWTTFLDTQAVPGTRSQPPV